MNGHCCFGGCNTCPHCGECRRQVFGGCVCPPSEGMTPSAYVASLLRKHNISNALAQPGSALEDARDAIEQVRASER